MANVSDDFQISFHYSAQNNVRLKMLVYDREGNRIGWVENTYDTQGNHIYYIVGSGDSLSGAKLEYDTEGNKIGQQIYNLITWEGGRKSTWKYTYEYDTAGRIIKKTSYGGDGDRYGIEEYVYEKDHLIKTIKYKEDGESTDSWIEYKYDARGNQTGIMEFGSDGILWNQTEYQYDSMGNITEKITSEHGKESRVRYQYDSMGNRICDLSLWDDGTEHIIHRYEYDSEGNTVRAIEYDSEDNIRVSYEIKYRYYRDGDNSITYGIWE